MKGKIDVTFTVSNYGADPRVVTRALLRKANTIYKKGSNAGALILNPKHEIAKFETLQLIAAKYNKLAELDQLLENSRGNAKLVIENMPAEFIRSKTKEGREYYVVLVNFGTEKIPHVRGFYLSDMHVELLQTGFKPLYDFDFQENPALVEEDDEPEETE